MDSGGFCHFIESPEVENQSDISVCTCDGLDLCMGLSSLRAALNSGGLQGRGTSTWLELLFRISLWS